MYIKILRYISFIILLLFIFSCSGLGFFDRFIPDEKVLFSWANITPNKNTDHIALDNEPLTLEATIAIKLISLQYQWESAKPGSTIFTDIVGATNSTYKIPIVSDKNHNQHQYRCKITRSTDVSFIRYTGIITLGVISFVNQPINQNFDIGAALIFNSEVSYDKPNLIRYQWQSAMRGSTIFTDIQGATKHLHTIPNITNDYHKRQYRCVISINDLKFYSKTGTLFSNTAPFTVNTIAGNGLAGTFSGDGGLAISAAFNFPTDIAVDAHGNIYIVDTNNHRIRKIDTSGIITTIAGSGVIGFGTGAFSGDGGLATSARLDTPEGVAVDNNGNIYIADRGNHRIRKIDTSGIITTIAGIGTGGYNGHNMVATAVELNQPQGVAVDDDGNIYIADTNNNRLREIDASTSILTDIISNGSGLNRPTKVTVDNSGNVYVTSRANSRILKIDTDKIITNIVGTVAVPFNLLEGIAVSDSGHLYFTDVNLHNIKRYNLNNSTLENFVGASMGVFVGDGDIHINAGFNTPTAIAVDGKGDLYIVDRGNSRIRKISD